MPNESGEWIMRGVDWDDPLRIRTPEELINYIDQVGFLPLFANELPGLSRKNGSPVLQITGGTDMTLMPDMTTNLQAAGAKRSWIFLRMKGSSIPLM